MAERVPESLLAALADLAAWLDITFGGLQFERAALELSVTHLVGGVSVRLPRVEDLLVMKAIARRPKDTEDMRGLLAAHPEVDLSELFRPR